MTSALLGLLLAAGPMKVAVMTLEAGEGVPEKTAAAITEAVVAEIRRNPTVSVVTPSEISTVLGFERQKMLMGCREDTSCMTEIGSALGVDRLLMGSLAKLGQSWLVHLKLIDSSKGSAAGQSDRRLKDKSIDDVLDVLPEMVVELFGKAPPASAVRPVAEPVTPPAAAPARPESGGVDEPANLPAEAIDKLRLLTDGKGHYLAVTGYDGPFLAGDGQSFWEQRVIGGGAEGDIQFNLTFWDPRIPAAYQRSIDFKDGKYVLTCGEAKIPYQLVPAATARPMLKKARLYKPRWRRAALALARDDDGNYYLVDGPREDNDESRKIRLFHGPRGKLFEVPLNDAIHDAKGMLLVSSRGRLRLPARGDEGEWTDPRGVARKLTRLDLGPSEARLIYRDLGIYQGDPLRTACEPHL
jgi:TolB-like protein